MKSDSSLVPIATVTTERKSELADFFQLYEKTLQIGKSTFIKKTASLAFLTLEPDELSALKRPTSNDEVQS